MNTEACKKKRPLPGLMCARFLLFGPILLLAWGAAIPSNAAERENLYYWFCDPRKSSGVLRIEVQLRDSLINLSQVTYCKTKTRLSRSPEDRKRIEFHFVDTESVFSDKKSVITGILWQAGAETDGILLGVSFLLNDGVVVNTIHPALRGEEFVSSPKEGVVVKTSAL